MAGPVSTGAPSRGEVWFADLGTTRGHEQSGRRPVAVLSIDEFNEGPALLVIVAPITSRARVVRSYAAVDPPEGGLSVRSYVKCEDIRSISQERLLHRMGELSAEAMAAVGERLRILLHL